jgi:GT2 family glycosyltransferase
VAPTLTVLIVSWNTHAELARTLPALVAELAAGDELIVVDNGSSDGSPELVAELAPTARLVRNSHNAGFAGACNRGAALATGDLLVILNPDAAPMAGWGAAIRRPCLENRGWAAWQALVADHHGAGINSAGNPVHFTGLVWAGSDGRPISAAHRRARSRRFPEPASRSPVRPGNWRAASPKSFFLYHEDVDLSLRLRIAGGALGIEPSALSTTSASSGHASTSGAGSSAIAGLSSSASTQPNC